MRKFLFIFLGLALTSCFSNISPNDQARYLETKSYFDSRLTEHLPKILPNEVYGSKYSNGEYEGQLYEILYLKTRFKFQRRYEKQKKKLLSKSIYSIKATDINSIKVFTEETYSPKELEDTFKSLNKMEEQGYPIPSIACASLNDKSFKRFNEVHVVEADTTISLNYTERPQKTYLPANWKKGYSIGFTTNDKYLLIDYWIVVW